MLVLRVDTQVEEEQPNSFILSFGYALVVAFTVTWEAFCYSRLAAVNGEL